MKAYCFFSVHESVFHPMARLLSARGITEWSGFVWSREQERRIANDGIAYAPLVVFTRDLLPKADDGTPPDLAWLAKRERELGVSLQRMLAAERHLLARRSFDQILRMAEVALREIASAYDVAKPDFVFSEDIACFHSYAHFAIARERGLPFWSIGAGRLPGRIAVYSSGFQHLEKFEQRFAELQRRGMSAAERDAAEQYLQAFVERPVRPPGMKTRAKKPGIGAADLRVLKLATKNFFGDRGDPTATPPLNAIGSRLRRIARVAIADATGVFEKPVDGEPFFLFPLHFQPEATTLVQAPLYVDQLALIRDIAQSLPAGHRLYVKEHVSSRGRRPLGFYEAIRAIPAARLLGPDEDTWSLIRNAAAVTVITGTVGWEGLLFGKPVITFGDVFMNLHPSVIRAGAAAKDAWFGLFERAVREHVHDRDAVVRMIAALQYASEPGFIANPNVFPEARDPDNIERLANALLRAVLPGTSADEVRSHG